MKYRIKIITYKTGRKIYIPQHKPKWALKWFGLDSNGTLYTIECECDSREAALSRIDLHYAGNTTTQKIEFEYITK